MPETFLMLGEPAETRDGFTRCQWCGKPADLHDIDGAWCTPEHRQYDRQSETTVWRRWEQ